MNILELLCHGILTYPTSVWYAASGVITLFSPILNYGLGHIQGAIAPWRYMYIVGGTITILWSLIVYFFMPPDPIRAKGFTERERYIAVARLRVNNGGVRNTHFKIQHVLELLVDEKFWLIFAQAFLSMIAAGPVNTFMPIIISGFGFNVLNTLLLTIPAGAVGAILILGTTYTTYKLKNVRTYAILVCELLVIMASLMLWLLPRTQRGGLLFAVYMLVAYSGGWGVIMGLSIANAAGYTKRVVSSSAIHVGYCLGEFDPKTLDLLPRHVLTQFSQVNLLGLCSSGQRMPRIMPLGSSQFSSLRPCLPVWRFYIASSVSGKMPSETVQELLRVMIMPTRTM